MSVSLWRYTEECDGDYCCGDCDLCNKEPEESEESNRMTEYDRGYKLGYQHGMTAAKKAGHWIVEGCYCMAVGICSECGIGTDEYKEFKYCPNCGAKMGVQNGN